MRDKRHEQTKDFSSLSKERENGRDRRATRLTVTEREVREGDQTEKKNSAHSPTEDISCYKQAHNIVSDRENEK